MKKDKNTIRRYEEKSEYVKKYKEGKFFYGQVPPSGESTTAECGVNYQQLAVITKVAQWGTPCCS